MTDRAALVERVADIISMVFEGQGITDTSNGVIDLIRVEVLEEAARCAEMMSGSVRRGNIADAFYIPPTAKEAAAAIRALKGDTPSKSSS
jgi:hypothetical protein